MTRPSGVPAPAPLLASDLLDLIRAAARAKRAAGQMYGAWKDTAPGAASMMVANIARDEQAHASMLDALLMELGDQPAPDVPVPGAGCGLNDEQWPSALMSAFALDQAITAAMTALAHAPHPRVAAVAQRISHEERAHQRFAVESFRVFATQDPALGRHLALEMLDARTWVQKIFPRRKVLGALADAGLLPPEAPRAHDSFLAGLGDTVQDALGVLGEL